MVGPKESSTSKNSSVNGSISGQGNSSASKINSSGYSYSGANKSFGSSMTATKRQAFNLNTNISSIPPTVTQLKSRLNK